MATNKTKTILITGATAGIGRHAALYLAKRGHRVFATGRNETLLAALRDEAKGTALETLRLDVNDAASIAAAARAVDERTGGYGLDVLVNNAGYGHLGPMEEVNDANLRAQFETNVFGLVAVTRAFLPRMRERGSGRVINVSSVGGRLVLPFFGAYNATKYAVEAISDALRIELGGFGVQVSLIEPGVINTEFTDRAMTYVATYDRPDSPYASALARADEVRKMSDRSGVGPLVISKAIERAATAWWPRARYVAPFRARLMLAFFAITPTWIMDGIFRWAMAMTKSKLAAHQQRVQTSQPKLADKPAARAA